MVILAVLIYVLYQNLIYFTVKPLYSFLGKEYHLFHFDSNFHNFVPIIYVVTFTDFQILETRIVV